MLLPRGAQRSLRSARTQQRTLWSTVTLISTSPSSLLSHLKDQPTSPATTATLFALSKNTPQDLVASFRSALTPSPAAAVAGCLSEVLPPSLLPSSASSGEVFSLSLAQWSPDTPSERAALFRSSLTGRPNIALGREIKPEADHDGAGSDAGFEAFLRGEKWGFGDQASVKKANGEGISELNGVNSKDVSQLVCLTADRLTPFLAALSAYPTAATAGLVGSSTPFHSPAHHPYSLFVGEDEAYATGAVGFAIVGGGKKVVEKLNYGGLTPLGAGMEVTSSRGNIVLLLSGQNAAKTLLNEVNTLFGTAAQNLSAAARSEEKEKEFYAAVFEQDPGATPDLSQAKLVAKINAGDPSRGAMSVETEEEVAQGSYLVFLHRPSAPPPPPSSAPSTLSFISLAPSYTSPHFSASECPAEGDVFVLDAFLAASENGVVHSTGQGRKAVCAIEGAEVSLSA